tara:strand:+ start:2284 stop:2490 length:207 start_codon:yes stop_codon:yes gene_type:complete
MSDQLEEQNKELKVRIFDLNEQAAQLNNIISQVANLLGCLTEDNRIDVDKMMEVAGDYAEAQAQPEED